MRWYSPPVGEDSATSRGKFGRYALGPELGSGGMATVSFGVATGALGFARPVAIKRIHPTLTRDPALVDAIRDEARIASRVRHTNVVSVIDVIEEEDGVGIVLEYVHGEALSSLLRSSAARLERLPLGVAVAVVVDVLHGLHAAHTAVDETGVALGIVHRDVSPQNVLVGADGIARVLDFGISKAENRASVTRDGQVKGKLRYMAPEQLGGDVTAAADTYAAGLILWEALAGCSPFDDIDDCVQLLGRVLMGVTVAPSARRADIPAVLDAIVARALAVPAGQRFATAASMAEALEATGLVASRTAVATCVNELAREVLDARAKVVALLERGLPADAQAPPVATEKTSAEPVVRARDADAPRTTRVLPWALAIGLGLLASWFAVASRSAPLPPSAARHEDAPPAVVSASASASVSAPSATVSAPSATASAVTPLPRSAPTSSASGPAAKALIPSAPVSAARPPGKLKKSRPGVPSDCAVPYTVDANGDRRYRRECFE